MLTIKKSLFELLETNPDLKMSHDQYNINVTSNYGNRLEGEAAFQEMRSFNGEGMPAHLYFHLPLCNYICHFCNYVKKLMPKNQNRDEVLDEWAELLIEESRRHQKEFPWTRSAKIESIYLGGGTAALFKSRQLQRLMNYVRSAYQISESCEISLEGNPDNYIDGSLADALSLGFNRFSLGVQSLQDEVNRFVGRGHDSAMSLLAIERLLEIRRPFNVDMMFGLPHQSRRSVREDFETLTSMKIPTITIYRLRNADREQMGIGNRSAWNNVSIREKMQSQGLFPSLEETYAMREEIVEILSAAGYSPSPCGWWSLPGVYGEGNIPQVSKNKWERQDSMIAFGPGVYGWLTGKSPTTIQTHNVSDIKAYADCLKSTQNLPIAFVRKLSVEQSVATALGFGFKANQPIRVERFKERFGVDLLRDEPYSGALQTLIDRGFLSFEAGSRSFRPTEEGEALHEEVISKLIHQRIGDFCENVCKRTA